MSLRPCKPRKPHIFQADPDLAGVVTTPLMHGQILRIDEADMPLVQQYRWHAKQEGRSWYAYGNTYDPEGKRGVIKLHRLLLNALPSQFVDHVDGNGMNNTRANLRIATKQQNQANVRKRLSNRTGYKGVQQHHDGRFRARIQVKGVGIHLGMFNTAEEAYAAYCTAARKHFGEFARIEEEPIASISS